MKIINWLQLENSKKLINTSEISEKILSFLISNSYASLSKSKSRLSIREWQIHISTNLSELLTLKLGSWVAGVKFESLFNKSYSKEIASTLVDEIILRVNFYQEFLGKFYIQLQKINDLNPTFLNVSSVFQDILALLIDRTKVEAGWGSTFESAFVQIFHIAGFSEEASERNSLELLECCRSIQDYKLPNVADLEAMAMRMEQIFLKLVQAKSKS